MTVTVFSQTETLQHMTYEFDADFDIHMMRFHDNTPEAIKEGSDVIGVLYADITEDDILYLLIDYRESGIPSMQYLIRQARQQGENFDVHPTAYLAIVTRKNFMITMLNTLLRTLNFGHMTTRFFGASEAKKDALAWLRSLPDH